MGGESAATAELLGKSSTSKASELFRCGCSDGSVVVFDEERGVMGHQIPTALCL